MISLSLLVCAGEALGCGVAWYTPRAYYMYRVYELQPESARAESPSMEEENCREWQRLTSEEIPLKEIYQVVYTMPLEEFERIYDNREPKYENRFVEWITKRDTALLDLLLLAKTNEYIRFRRNSRWYYPSMKIGARMTLEEIAQRALSVEDRRVRDRYLLQAIRALFSLSRYQECVTLWEEEVSLLPAGNLMRRLIQPYIAGTKVRIKRSERAIAYFAERGDVESMLFSAGRTGEELSTIDALDLVCQYAPNSDYVAKTLQLYVRELEPVGAFFYAIEENYEDDTEVEKLYSLCLRMGRNRASNNPAMWYYTAAFLDDLRGQPNRALSLLNLAEQSKSTPFITESMRVLRIYLEAKTRPCNASYERWLSAQLQWLDGQIERNIDDKVRKETAATDKLLSCQSYYYWNDMMRRILLAEVCPRMIKAGNHIRALQLANMADNRLLGLVNRMELSSWELKESGEACSSSGLYTMHQYRYSKNNNDIDYSNFFFEMIDSLGVDVAIRYVERVQKPQSEFDRFLNDRGYVGSDYLNDILGTQCLRNMRYKEAVTYLGRVSRAYENHLNLSMRFEPFSPDLEEMEPKGDFRYDFACEMFALEQLIDLTTEANRRAELLLKFATGIGNSFGPCWPLTQYYRGTHFTYMACNKRDWERDRYSVAARKRAVQLAQQACDIATDSEVAANIHYALCNYKSVAERYPNTEKGRLVRGACDKLRDYHVLAVQ